MTGVSFIVPVYNGEKTLRECLDSILSQDLTHPFEVIVVDNESTDHTPEILASYTQINVIKAPAIRNRARARNFGARVSMYPVLAFIDCDTILAKDWASTLLPTLKKPFGASQTTIVTKYKSKQEETYYLSPHSSFQTMDSCSLMILRSAFFEVGGFEESLSRWEDSHLTMKLLGHGYGLIVTAPSKIIKYENRSLFQLYKRLFETGRAEGVAFKSWYQESPMGPSRFANLRFQKSILKAFVQIMGQMTAGRKSFPPLKSKGGWTFISETLAISKYLNVLVTPDFICFKSLSNNVVHTIYKGRPNFDIIIKKVTSGEEFWDDLLLHIPEDSLIIRKDSNEKCDSV